MDSTVRLGTVDDLNVAVALWEEAQSTRKGTRFLAPAMVEMETNRLSHENACFLILEERGRAIGLALFSPARENAGTGEIISGLAHISSVAIKPTHWGRGLGRRLMNAVLEGIKIRGYTTTQLWTQPGNLRAVSLYTSLGFEPTGEEKSFEDERIIRYVLRLVN